MPSAPRQVREAFPKHPFAGFYNGWLCIVVNVVDLALYPALISAYIAQLTPEGALSGAVTWAIRLASVAAVWRGEWAEVASSCRGEQMGTSSPTPPLQL